MKILAMVPLCLAPLALAAAAQPAPKVAMRLVAGWAEPDGARVAGLEMAVAPGWKTYWRAPGEAGIPPVFDWGASENIADVAVEWPAPTLFDSFGLATLGYGGEVTLPLRVTPVDPAKPVTLRVTVDYGVCAEICIPERAELSLAIPPGAASEGEAAIAAARLRAPADAAGAGLVSAACGVEGAGAERRFAARLAFDPAPAEPPFVVVEGPPGAWFGTAEASVEGGAVLAAAAVQVHPESLWIGRDSLTLTLIGPDGAIELRGCPAG